MQSNYGQRNVFSDRNARVCGRKQLYSYRYTYFTFIYLERINDIFDIFFFH